MALTVEKVQHYKDLGWKVAKTILKGLAYVGGGIIVGAACAGVDTGNIGKVAKVATGVGLVGLASAAGEVAADQLDKAVDQAREVSEFGEDFVDNMDKIREQKKTEAEAAAAV